MSNFAKSQHAESANFPRFVSALEGWLEAVPRQLIPGMVLLARKAHPKK
jgi:hypothetical protein